MINGPPEEGPERAGRTIYEGLAKSSTREVGMQVPGGDHPEVSAESALREDPPTSWRNTSGVVPAARDRDFGGEGDAGSCSPAAERSPEVQHCPHDRLFEGQERNSSPSECAEDKRDFVRPKLLVERVLCQHGWLGRERYSRVHQAPGETPKAASPIEPGTQLTAPFRGLPHTTGFAGGR